MQKKTKTKKPLFFSVILFLALFTPLNSTLPFAFIFAGTANGVDVVAHPIGYFGTGGTITVTVGIDPTSANATDMIISTQNVIDKFNNSVSTVGNVVIAPLPSGNVDFESVLLHEMGHSLGLAHCNLATESGLAPQFRDYTKSLTGPNGSYDLDPGPDGIIGSADDIRGDDVNLNYFKITDNNPFTIAPTIDQSTYSRDLADLPSGNYSTNPDRTVSGTLGVPNTEGVMQQGTFGNEAQRTLTADDVAGLRYAMAGVDEIQGTADDYTLVLTYAGLTTSADIVIDFDNSETGFAVSQSGGVFLNSNHISITQNNIYFNTGFSWYFNTVSSTGPSPPNVVCASYTAQLSPGGTVTILPSDVDGGTSDPDGDPFTLSVSPNTFTCADLGENTVTLTATDTDGSSTCQAIVTVVDNGPDLTAVCQDISVSLDALGNASIIPDDIDGGSTSGNCGFNAKFMTSGTTSNTLTTSFAATTLADGNMFDIVAQEDIIINSFDINLNTGFTSDIEVYFKEGTWVGSENNASDWTLVATASGVTSNGFNNATPLNLSMGISVESNKRVAFYVTQSTNLGGFWYTIGTAVGNTLASDANLTLFEGAGKAYPFGNTFSPRDFNGNIIYDTRNAFSGNFDTNDLGANTITLNVKDIAGNLDTCDAIVTVNENSSPCFRPPNLTGTPEDSDTALASVSNSTSNWPANLNNAILALESKEKGLVITRLPNPETAIGTGANAVEGMIVYDTDDECLKLFNGTTWTCITQRCPD